MLDRYGPFIVRRARWALAVSAVVFVGMVALGVGAFGVLKGGGFDDPSAASSRAAKIIDDRFGGEVNLILLVEARSGTVDSAGPAASGTALGTRLAQDPSVTGVLSYWPARVPGLKSADGRSGLIAGRVAGDEKQVKVATERILGDYVKDDAAVTVQAGGNAAVELAAEHQVTSDLAKAEAIAIPVTLLLLVLVFGSLVAASLPLVIGFIAIIGTFAELALLGRVTDVSVFAINLATALGLGLGIDYGLLLVSRFRERLTQGAQVADAVADTVKTAGRTILFSAATVALALAALGFFPLYLLRSFAFAGIGVVVIAAGGALIVVPALLAVLGHRVNKWKVPWSRADRGPASPAWGRLAGLVMRRPLLALPVLALFALLASPLLHVSFGTPDETVLPAGVEVRQVSDSLRADFAGDQATAMQVVANGPLSSAAAAGYAATLSRLPSVTRVESSAGSFAQGRAVATPANPALGRPDAQRFVVLTTLPGHSPAAQRLVGEVRAVPPPSNVPTLVGGSAAQLVDTKHAIASRLPYAIGVTVLTTLAVLFLFTGSIVQPVRALVLNVLGLSATLGALVWIFQSGHLSGILGFTPRPMETAMTILFFCVAFGLSMDYEVFVTSRIKELHDAGAANRDAVTEGLARTGRLVSAAAALLAVSFFAFGTASVSFLQMFGLGCGLAILIDALLIRGILAPAAFRALGRYAWWAPRWMTRLHGRIGVSEAETAPPPKKVRAGAG